ncbi:MAG: hypothetical protein ACYCXK_05465 [Candidatus Humimicrobiaceae bacterium]
MFGRKKVEKPKSILGSVLFEYDKILNSELKDIIKSISEKKNLNPGRTGKLFNNISLKFKSFINNISKDKFKTDYRSDKARDLMIDMFNTLMESFEKIRAENFELQSPALENIYSKFEYVLAQRELIRKKLKDVESDYI